MTIKPIFDQSMFVKAALNSVHDGRPDGRRPHRPDDPAVPGQLAADADHPGVHPAVDHDGGAGHVRHRRDPQHDDPGRIRPGGRHSGGQRHRGDREHRTPHRPGEPIWRTRSSTAPAKSASPRSSRRCAICIVFVPVFLLQGTAKYLFSPLSVSVIVSLLASLLTLLHAGAGAVQVPDAQGYRANAARDAPTEQANALRAVATMAFNRHFQRIPPRPTATRGLGRCVTRSWRAVFVIASWRFLAPVSAPRDGLLPAGGRGADAPARARAHRHAAGENPGDVRARSRRPSARLSAATRWT